MKAEDFTLENKEYIDFQGIVTVIILTMLWGLSHPTIKIANNGISPVFSSALRSVIASICGVIYCINKRERLFHGDIILFHGFMVGLLFGLEFACLYFGLLYTDASRSIVFVNFSPFFVAIGAHFFIRGDKLTFLKIVGLILAFSGVIFVFQGKPKTAHPNMIIGDILEVLAALFWGATTLYIKRFLAERVHPINTFLYQLIFSIPVLFLTSLILEPRWIYKIDIMILSAFLYQCFIIAFLSFFIWFKLIHRYSVSRLSAFNFLTPLFGVIFGTVLLREEFTSSLMLGLPLVCLGIFLVNFQKR